MYTFLRMAISNFFFVSIILCSISQAGDVQHENDLVDISLKNRMDKGQLHINSTLQYNVDFYTLSQNCIKCPYSHIASIIPDNPVTFYVNTTHTTYMQVRRNENGVDQIICHLEKQFGEYGIYFFFLTPNSSDDNVMCSCFYKIPPVNSNLPILIAFAIYVALFVLFYMVQCLYRHRVVQKFWHFLRTDRLVNADLGSPPVTSQQTPILDDIRELSTGVSSSRGNSESEGKATSSPRHAVVRDVVRKGASSNGISRLRSLDTFRGFMFIMGTSIAVAFHKQLIVKKIKKTSLIIKIVKRSIQLFVLGLMVNSIGGGNDWSRLRIPGVLQRFSICYLVVALLEILNISVARSSGVLSRWKSMFQDVTSHSVGWLISLFFISVWLLVSFMFVVPGCGKGYLGPGGLHLNSSKYNCTGGAAGYIDRWFFTDARIYNHPTSKELYESTVPYDPEGMLGTLTSIFLVYLGLQAGKIFVFHTSPKDRIIRLLIWGVACCLIAGGLCGFSRDDGVIPINKNLWSLSFVFCLGGFAYILLAVLYLVIDVKQLWDGSPLFQPGMNSILLYAGHEFFHDILPFSWKADHTHAGQLTTDLVGTTLWVLIACYWHHIQFYVNL